MPGGRGGAGRGVGPRREHEDRGRRRLQHRGQLRRRAAGARLNPLASCAGRGRGPGRGGGGWQGSAGAPLAGDGGGASTGGGEGGGTSGLGPPLRPPPPSRALPRRCRARERGEREGRTTSHETPRNRVRGTRGHRAPLPEPRGTARRERPREGTHSPPPAPHGRQTHDAPRHSLEGAGKGEPGRLDWAPEQGETPFPAKKSRRRDIHAPRLPAREREPQTPGARKEGSRGQEGLHAAGRHSSGREAGSQHGPGLPRQGQGEWRVGVWGGEAQTCRAQGSTCQRAGREGEGGNALDKQRKERGGRN